MWNLHEIATVDFLGRGLDFLAVFRIYGRCPASGIFAKFPRLIFWVGVRIFRDFYVVFWNGRYPIFGILANSPRLIFWVGVRIFEIFTFLFAAVGIQLLEFWRISHG